MAIIIGIIGGFGAVGIQFLIKFFKELFWGTDEYTIQYLTTLPIYIRVGVPIFGGLIVGLIVHFFSKEAKGHGVPEVMEAIALNNGIIRARVVFAKLFASAIYIGSGGSVGREGPVIQIGSAIGSAVGQFIRVNPQRMKVFVACGAASGIAAAFNAPVAGALFAVEIILGDFAVAQFSPIVISSVMATVVSRHFLGDFPAFVVPVYHLLSPFELIPYAILGVLAGVVSIGFIKTLYGMEDLFDKWKKNDMIKAMLGGAGIGLLALWVPQVLGVGYETMNNALLGKMTWQLMFLLIFVKMFATSLSLSSGGSGGIFAPALFLGTMTGGFFGDMVLQYWPGLSGGPGAYALVGMGAVVAGTTHAPITAILIIFEMTNDYKIILPLMIAVIIATLISTKFQKESIYTLKLIRRGINLFKGKEVNLLRSIKVESAYTKNVITVPPDMNLKALLELIRTTSNHELYILSPKGKYLGVITLNEMRSIFGVEETVTNLLIAIDFANKDIPNVNLDDNLDTVMKIYGKWELNELPVVSKDGNELLGIISRQASIDAYNNALQKRNLGEEVSQSIRMLDKLEQVHISEDYSLAEIHVPKSLVGKTLKNTKIRQKFSVQIILIKRPATDREPEIQFSPGADDIIEGDDILIVLGKKKEINLFKKSG